MDDVLISPIVRCAAKMQLIHLINVLHSDVSIGLETSLKMLCFKSATRVIGILCTLSYDHSEQKTHA